MQDLCSQEWVNLYKLHSDAVVPQIKLDGCQWSLPFSVDKETTMHIALRKEDGGRRSVRIEIRGYEEGSRFLVMFRLGSARGPYRYDLPLMKMHPLYKTM